MRFAVDHGSFVAGEIHGCCADVIGFGQFSAGNLAQDEAQEIWILQALTREIRFNECRCDRIDGDPVLGPVHGQRTHQLDDRTI